MFLFKMVTCKFSIVNWWPNAKLERFRFRHMRSCKPWSRRVSTGAASRQNHVWAHSKMVENRREKQHLSQFLVYLTWTWDYLDLEGVRRFERFFWSARDGIPLAWSRSIVNRFGLDLLYYIIFLIYFDIVEIDVISDCFPSSNSIEHSVVFVHLRNDFELEWYHFFPILRSKFSYIYNLQKHTLQRNKKQLTTCHANHGLIQLFDIR